MGRRYFSELHDVLQLSQMKSKWCPLIVDIAIWDPNDPFDLLVDHRTG